MNTEEDEEEDGHDNETDEDILQNESENEFQASTLLQERWPWRCIGKKCRIFIFYTMSNQISTYDKM